MTANGAAFYCMSSELYFPGAVALVNSLRLQGHEEPIYLLDCGLRADQRELLAREATIVPAPLALEPYQLKTVAPRLHPAGTMVLIDVDMVATRPLTPLIESVAAGGVAAFKDNIDRFDERWGELLELGTLRPRPYVSSGLVVLGGELGQDVLRLWDERNGQGDHELSYFARDVPGYPFRFLDQDVLNAVLCSLPEAARVEVMPADLAPHQPYRGLRLVDPDRLRCAYADGREPFVLHQYLEKPWVKPMYHGIYSQLLSRLWLADDAPLRLRPELVPLRMRSGRRAWLSRMAVDAWDLGRWYVQDVIPDWVRARRGADPNEPRRR